MSLLPLSFAQLAFLSMFLSACAPADDCSIEIFKDQRFTVCSYALAEHDIRILHGDKDGKPYGSIPRLKSQTTAENKVLVFAMNGGMYEYDLSPVGLLKVDGNIIGEANLDEGFGNFFLKPNGFLEIGESSAAIHTMDNYYPAKQMADFATQSGPMLVINGVLHPKFLPNSNSRKLRNGVGISQDGKQIYFAISHNRVNFYDFGSLFKDKLKTPNALFLDGTISTLYHPTYARPNRYPVGPIIAITQTAGPSLIDRMGTWLKAPSLD